MLDETSLYSYTILLKYNCTHAHVLACLNASANMYPIMSDGTLMSLTYYTRDYTKGCTHQCAARVDTYMYTTRMSPTYSRQRFRG